MNSVCCLMGPTASGKTALSIGLAKRFSMEIISVDSAMIYKGMDIGTAKPTMAEREGILHHLIDIKNPQDSYSAGDFCKEAESIIADIISRGKQPLLVGGTMMYFNTLQNGMAILPESNPDVREKIWQAGETNGWEVLHQQLNDCDPASAAHIHPNDKQRIQRALEVYEISGVPLSTLQKESKAPSHLNFINLAILPEDRFLLHERIEARVESMLKSGFSAEVKAVINQPDMNADKPSMRSVGYRQWYQYLQGNVTQEEAKNAMIAATRQLAKRQLTWLRSWPNLNRLTMEDPEILHKAFSVIESF